AWREMKDQGINPYRNLKSLRFGTNHDRVVMAVLKGEVDAGTVRTDIIERMSEEGIIHLKDIKVINEQKVKDFPFLLSTRLYPEWPFARLRHVPEELSEKVAIALLSMPPHSIAAIASESAGWTIPLDYHPVHELMKELRVGPYKDFGKVTLKSFVIQYWYLIVVTFGIIFTLTAFVIIIMRLNRRLMESKLKVQHAMEGLEILVKDRTAELENKNRELTLEIEKRKQSELMLRESEEKFRSLVEQSLTGVYIIQDGSFIYANPEMARIFGYETEEIINKKTPHDLTAEDFHSTVKENIRRRLEGEIKAVHYTFKGKRKDGSLIDVEVAGSVTEIAGKPAIIGTIRDITEHVQIEKEREAQRRFLQSVLDNIPDQIMVIRPDFRIELINSSLKKEMGADTFCYKVSHGRDVPCDGEEHPCPLKEVMDKKKEIRIVHEHKQVDGSKIVVEIMASPIFNEKGEIVYILETSRDITERVRLEEEHRRLMEKLYLEEKEQSIITLTGGIAHDFNNMLTAVSGSAELLRLKAKKEDLSYIDNIIKSSERMAGLVRQMLAYSGQGIYQPSNINLNESIRNAIEMTHKGKYLKIQVNLNLEDKLWLVFADRQQMDQLMINIILNAFEAMEETGGTLSIRTSNIKITEKRECYPLKQYLSEGKYVEIRVSDSGPGIPEAFHKKIFDPFFTTKFMGRGLGLPAVAGIVKSHNGCLSLESEEGKGTTFTIYLPRAVEPEITKKPVIKSPGNGILIVDDEETILNLIKETLSGAGFNIYTATDGFKALDKFKEAKDQIKVAIIDIEMPGMDGKRLISELRDISKNLNIIVSSGYDEEMALSGIEPRPDGFIQKPYRLSILLSKVKEFIP
ncbi:MAG: PAS domain S-box protein, partial [Thermodesulfovibrionales bacterium]